MESININIPKGYEIDIEKSNFINGEIVFKKQEVNYDNIIRKLFLYKKSYYIDNTGTIREDIFNKYSYQDEVNCTSREQAEKLLAINRLMNVAKYLNGDWQPDWDNSSEPKFVIEIYNNNININDYSTINQSVTCFKSRKLAQQAIDILGKEIILKCFQNY